MRKGNGKMNGTIVLSTGQTYPVTNVQFGAQNFRGAMQRTVSFDTMGMNTIFIFQDNGQILKIGNRIFYLVSQESNNQNSSTFGRSVRMTMFVNGDSIDVARVEAQITELLENASDGVITTTDADW